MQRARCPLDVGMEYTHFLNYPPLKEVADVVWKNVHEAREIRGVRLGSRAHFKHHPVDDKTTTNAGG